MISYFSSVSASKLLKILKHVKANCFSYSIVHLQLRVMKFLCRFSEICSVKLSLEVFILSDLIPILNSNQCTWYS
jgi:hypothetical protein